MPRYSFNRLIIDTRKLSQFEIVTWMSRNKITAHRQTPNPSADWHQLGLTVFVRRDKVDLVKLRYPVVRDEPVIFYRQTTAMSSYTIRELEMFYSIEHSHTTGIDAEHPNKSRSLVSAYYRVRGTFHRLALLDDPEKRQKEVLDTATRMQTFAGDPPYKCSRAWDYSHYCVGPDDEDGVLLIHRAGKDLASLKHP